MHQRYLKIIFGVPLNRNIKLPLTLRAGNSLLATGSTAATTTTIENLSNRTFLHTSTESSSKFTFAGISESKYSKSNSNIMGDNEQNDHIDIWSNDDKESFASLSHVGYSVNQDPVTQTGGWLAHRLAQEQPSPASTSIDEEDPTCWIRDEASPKMTKFDYTTMPIGRSPRILVLYGSLRPTSFSKKLAYEFARLLEALDCDVRVYNPQGLPVRDPSLEHEDKVRELRALTLWSDGHMWVSPEMHGQITGVFKNQIDWIPLNTGSVRPTQGRTCCVAQVNGGSQSFNAVNSLRLLARWMRMPCVTNQSAVPKAWKEFGDDGRMKESSFRDRVVDVAEEFAKFTAVLVPVAGDLTDRYSERKEKEAEGKLLTQAEKEAKSTVTESKKG